MFANLLEKFVSVPFALIPWNFAIEGLEIKTLFVQYGLLEKFRENLRFFKRAVDLLPFGKLPNRFREALDGFQIESGRAHADLLLGSVEILDEEGEERNNDLLGVISCRFRARND